jgi:hypothetical protein
LFKDIFSILVCLSHHKNNDIAQKILELNSLIKRKIIEEIFENCIDFKEESYSSKLLSVINYNNENNSNSINYTNYSLNLKKNIKSNINLKSKTSNRKSSTESNETSSAVVDNEDKKFEEKIEELKKQILFELKENIRTLKDKCTKHNNSLTTSNQTNKDSNFNLIRNASSKKLDKNESLEINEKIKNFTRFKENKINDKKSEKIKVNKNDSNIYNKINENNDSIKSGFYNNKEGNKKENNKENCLNNENCIIDNSIIISTETYNIDSSIVSIRENTLKITSQALHNTRLRRQSCFDFKEKNLKENQIKKQNSINNKSKFFLVY